MLRPRPSVARGRSCLGLLLLTTAMGCVGKLERYEILHRQHPTETFTDAGRRRVAPDYQHERAYIAERRRVLRSGPGNPEEDLVGLALSGGGIRSATFGLGVLQALHEARILDRIDYTSATSGGAYILGWLEAHYGVRLRRREPPRDHSGYETLASDATALLGAAPDDSASPNDHLLRLRSRAGFLDRGGFWPGVEMLWEYAWRLVPAFVIDVALHLKGNTNWQHIVDVYRGRIADTYLLGREDLTVAELDTNEHRTPYAVITANLVNSNLDEHRPFRSEGEFLGYNFEFTRDYTGSDGLGYVATEAFDQPVANVEWSTEPCAKDRRAVAVTVRGPTEPRPERSGKSGIAVKHGLPIATGVAAAGAAFDPDGAFGRSNLFTQMLGGSVGAALNLSLGYETWNYARGFNGPFWTPVDYGRMFTYQRVAPFLARRARWIKITDGGHYDNTSVFALLRRGVRTIIASEAVADGDQDFTDRLRLKDRAEKQLGIDEPAEDAAWLQPTVTLRRDGRHIATIHFIKPPREVCTCGFDPTIAVDAKICGYANANPTYPHTSTIRQWYDLESFEAYRLLGRKMTQERFASIADLAASRPVPTCTPRR